MSKTHKLHMSNYKIGLAPNLKSWPHSEMQCASSTANRQIPLSNKFNQKLP